MKLPRGTFWEVVAICACMAISLLVEGAVLVAFLLLLDKLGLP